MLLFRTKRDLKELTENGKFHDFIILENYLDQCVKLRLAEHGANNLREAHDISTIITRMFGILNQKFEGKIPNFELIEARKMVAKFIGLTFFKMGRECLVKFGSNCAVNGPCCALHRLEGLKEAHEIFPKLFEPFGIELDKINAVTDTFFTSLLAVLIDFKTQIVVSDLALASEKSTCEGLSVHLENLLENYYGNSMEIPYLKGKLQQRAVQIRGLLSQQDGNLGEKLMEKFPKDLFESNLKNVLRNIYSAFPETFLSEMITKNLQEVKEEKKVSHRTFTAVNIATVNTSDTAVNSTSVSSTTDNITENTADTIADEPFKNVIISGKFFRGILEPVDERFAAIIEGRDVNVKQYLSLRKKKAANNEKFAVSQPKKTKVNVPVRVENNNVNRTGSTSLMERHDSAERIAWETQPENSVAEEGDDHEIIRVNRPTHTTPGSSNRSSIMKKNTISGRGRRRFSDQEVANLIEGVRRFGNNWRRILDTYEFDDRSNVDLKDKARNLKVLGLL